MEMSWFWFARFFCGISFVFYNYVGFTYIENALSSVRLKPIAKILMSLMNTAIYLLFSALGFHIYFVYMAGFVTISLEFLFFYHLSVRRIIYVASTFMFNIVALRNIILSSFALVTLQPINQISGNDTMYNLSLAISFLLLDIFMFLFRIEKFVTFSELAVFAQAKVHEVYFASLGFLLFIYLLIFSGTHGYNIAYVELTLLNLLTPIILACLYYITLSYGISMSKTLETERRARALEHDLLETTMSKVRLESIAYFDSLTSVYNRRYCLEKIAELLSSQQSFSLCFVDVDKLKVVNDTFGHAAGDGYLQWIVQILVHAFRKNDIISRLGGDEFVVLLPNCPKYVALEKIEQANVEIMRLQHQEKLPYQPSISYGIVEVAQDTPFNVDELLEQADKLMYHFKMAKRGQEEL